ncbi:MAG: JAB domain-containing protein [Eubacteriales bacterium]|nr:hypothetical protein [Eubacterium sp.]MDD7179579.1 JAB domain-containing protein [Eubacterium sp.]MDY5494323.1 JAB domain-containing protein [Eubacteriales bacterium]CDE18296.1 uncharacterized protein BN797_00291 [Eubacterium sp. CAG:841]
MHKDHRKHTKDRFLSEGLDSFEPHNVLELLLFYSIPQKDTNETAHMLINRFGSLSAVFDAPYDDLLTVPGISEHSATLIKLIPAISRRYAMEKNSKVTKLSSIEDIGKYLVARYLGVTEETVLLLLLDNKFGLIDCVKVHEGSVNSSAITMRKLIETALFKRASMVVLAHNHPSGVALPSSDDLFTTQQVKRAFDLVEIGMLAHIIVAGDTFTNIL